MGRMESDLGTTLNWIGAVHYDTDDIHAHVIIRGVNERGQDLVIGRDYIASGIRARAQEFATELLGERSLEEIQKSQEKQVEALSVTSLDRFIEKNLKRGPRC
jgi:type IV secretory pathway VirD2 relaxase